MNSGFNNSLGIDYPFNYETTYQKKLERNVYYKNLQQTRRINGIPNKAPQPTFQIAQNRARLLVDPYDQQLLPIPFNQNKSRFQLFDINNRKLQMLNTIEQNKTKNRGIISTFYNQKFLNYAE